MMRCKQLPSKMLTKGKFCLPVAEASPIFAGGMTYQMKRALHP
jgi:hypothetical protein